ncbi:hypothetical protein CN918_27055 [Priestia megaterium]|nr:hypothetical protein CN918_27055 [Priestia megaterium]
MHLLCQSCHKDLSNLEGSIFFLINSQKDAEATSNVISMDTAKKGNVISELKLSCRSCFNDSYNEFSSLKEFMEHGDVMYKNALRENELHAPHWTPQALAFLESMLHVRENLFWGEKTDIVYQRNNFWIDAGYASEQEYFEITHGCSKDNLYTEYFMNTIHYKKFFNLFLTVAKEEGRIRAEGNIKANERGLPNPSNLSTSMRIIQELDDIVIEKISEWLEKVRIYKDDSTHYCTLISLILDEYNMVEEYHKTLEEAFSSVQKVVSRYLKTFEDVTIDLDYVHKEQLKERLDRITGRWAD